MVRSLPATQKTRVRSLGGEDALEKEMTTHCSILAWKMPWMEEPGRLQFMGLQSQTRLSDITHIYIYIYICICICIYIHTKYLHYFLYT